MKKSKGVLERYLEAAQKTGDIMLRYQYQKDMMKQDYYDRLEREQLVEDVGDYVLSHLSATIDAEEIIKAIKELNDALDDLGR